MPKKGSHWLFGVLLCFVLTSPFALSRAETKLVSTADFWAYWDYGFEDPGWNTTDYDDFEWSYGPSPLGFGEPYIVARLQPGIITAYFRTYFAIDAIPTQPVTLRVRRDDGVIVYLNGYEVFRNNMPQGPVDYSTLAVNTVEAGAFVEVPLTDVFYLNPGYNVIAAEVHQAQVLSDDLVFDLELVVSDGPPPRGVTITNPADNTTVAQGTDVTISAAPVPAGEVTSVSFYKGATLLGTDQQAPYEAILPSVQESNYVLRAVALFNDSTSITSAPVNLNVGAARVIRGPYLNTGTPTSLIVKWRTDVASDSVVRYGPAPGNLNQSASATGVVTDHEVKLTGLSPDTQYYYSVGSASGTQAGGADYYFLTPPAGPKPTHIWVLGDSGAVASGDFGAYAVRDAYYAYTGSRYTDLLLMLGDNAYQLGTDDEYQRGMFNVYPDMLRKTVVWSTIGNHEYYTDIYLDIFSFPKNGEAGGVASGVENYYSFDYGNIHFINLAGYYSGSRLTNAPMCNWLQADLEANTNKWIIAFWHQPPYTKGTHDSDWEQDHVEMRQNAVPILESYGVDLVLSGHSHVYERSYMLRGHYGYSWELQPSMVLDGGSGRVDDSGPYVKKTSGPNADHGTVYVVNGSSAWNVNCCLGLDHPAMYRSLAEIGSLVLDIDGDTLQGTFLRGDGVIDDYFTILKSGTIVRIVSITVDDGIATLSWTSTQGRHYQVEFTSDLAAGWQPAGNPIEAAGPLTTVGNVSGTPQGFYRVLQID
jgi:hypothetical protein